jgi:hypothetical protein
MNIKLGILMIWLSGFYVCLNLMSLLPHAGDVGASWGKVAISLALGLCGWMWAIPKTKIKTKGDY